MRGALAHLRQCVSTQESLGSARVRPALVQTTRSTTRASVHRELKKIGMWACVCVFLFLSGLALLGSATRRTLLRSSPFGAGWGWFPLFGCPAGVAGLAARCRLVPPLWVVGGGPPFGVLSLQASLLGGALQALACLLCVCVVSYFRYACVFGLEPLRALL